MKNAIGSLGYSRLILAIVLIVATPLALAAEADESPADAKEITRAKETPDDAESTEARRVQEARGPVRHPAGPVPVQVTPQGVVTVAVPSNVSRPAALYNLAPRPKALAVPRLAEVPTPKKYKPRAMGVVDPEFVAQQRPTPASSATPPLTTSFESLNFESNLTHAANVFIPPDSSGAAGPGHVVSVTNASLSFHDKATGVVTFETSLQAFFASLAPLTSTFDPKVVYDQFADRFIIVTLEVTQTAGGAPADTSRILVAASEDADPNGTWYLTAIDGSEVFFNPGIGASVDHWTDFPGLAVDEEVVYITGNLFAFGTGEFGGIRLWVIDKGLGSGGFYAGGAAGVSEFDPYAGCAGVCVEAVTQPAHIFGTAPAAPTNVGTWLVSYNGISDGTGPGFDEYVQVVRVDDPIGPGVTAFTQEYVSAGDIEDPFAASLPGAEQLGIADTISTNDRRALQAVWRDNDRLYVTTTILPDPPGPDAGQATAHWFQIDTAPLVGLTLADQGNVGGEDIHPSGAVHTFFPAISVNDDDTVAVGFSASSASIYAGSYYATRESVDPPGAIGSSFTLRAGLAPYLRTLCAMPPVNRWGDYSGMSVDPVDQCFWVYNQHALVTGSPTTATCQPAGNEVGRWGTAFGKVCRPTCGNGTVEPGETCEPPGAPAGANGMLCRGDCTACGDGTVDPGEDCDDANGTASDGCENDCTFTTGVCGDAMLNPPGESCDPPGQPAGANGNLCRADCTVCGDAERDPIETCDDGNTVNTDACRNDCTAPVCGDSIVDAQNGESCDPFGQPAGANANSCRVNCTVCGDFVVDSGEDCDDANTVDTDACRNNCTATACGDGIVDAGEECDDGNTANGDGCENDCTVTPICGDGQVNVPGETCDPPGQPAGVNGNDCRVDCRVCGDGIVDPGEDCDDANTDDLDACRNDCSAPRCGDGIVDALTSETCDPPGQPAGAIGNNCRGDCTVCGDGIQDASEDCDDGNAVDTDACRNDCSVPVCGDGIVDAGEGCDDGNAVGGDGCENDCTPTPDCGDGLINVAGETCDPPGQPAGANDNDCRADCTVCGDGVVDPGEDCDDANSVDTDACRNNCMIPACGDSTIDPGETCDPPGSPGGTIGNLCRADCTVCGDGNVDPSEECDDGNAVNFDDCRNSCDAAVCGDGIVDASEECDDGNAIPGDGCEDDCTETPFCGDGSIDAPDETCDPPGQPAGASGNDCRPDCTVCGDGVVDSGEECDDGNADDSDGCRNICLLPRCGDDVVSPPGETCDPPGQPAGASGNDCRGDCTVCGDGVVDAGEDCDDGNASDADACRNDCTTPICGDGIVDFGEDCDDGNAIAGDGCENDCTATPFCGDSTVDAPDETCDPPGQPAGASGNDCRIDCTVCGDGVVDAGEECDDGNADDLDGCRNDCLLALCGDGIVNAPGETCEPPGQPAGPIGNLCRVSCTVCGDGVVDPGEECDDGNVQSFDSCRNDCTLSFCGDGIVDAGEECDDGNTILADGCENDCTESPICGDGMVSGPDETCDPPGQPAGASGSTCRADCTVCGDGVVDTGEGCDDGNAVNGDGCESDCTASPQCGNGTVNGSDETCDPPGQPAGASGNTCRADCTVCGDGVVDLEEDCDDGNADDTDACRNDCTVPVCGDSILDTGETCDPPGRPGGVSGNFCRADCTVCGDGIQDPGEPCDDGNTFDFDNCRNDCTIPACGDGILDPASEECDDGNVVDGDGCETNCGFTRAGALTSLIFSRVPGEPEITLSWGPSCLTSDTDFAIYEGAFPNFYTHVPLTCSTGGSQTATFEPATYSTYYLIVPHNVNAEGSYGQGLGVERSASVIACKPRRLGVCL